MDFFKSVFADEPLEPSDSDEPQRQPQSEDTPASPPDTESTPGSNSSTAWSFGGLIKTMATKSESVIQTYRKDLEEFGSGLRMETAVIRDAASRAVKDLPASLEVGATVAQESLESVGQAIDDIGSSVWKSTAAIISQGKDSLLAAAAEDDDSDASENNGRRLSGRRSFDSKPYSRFEAQLRSIQSNASTYLDDPEDLGNYELWKSGFDLDKKTGEIENLIKENGEEIVDIYATLVPNSVDHESFWFRYFFKVHKLKEFEDARTKLVKRAISGEEEDLSWDFDDDEHKDKDKDENKSKKAQEKFEPESESAGISDNGEKEKPAEAPKAGENSDSCKDSDVSIVSRPEEEDLGWDEIEDIGSNDESKAVVGSGESSSRANLRKRLSNAAEEDEDLSWDIEDEDDDDDDDEQPKKS